MCEQGWGVDTIANLPVLKENVMSLHAIVFLEVLPAMMAGFQKLSVSMDLTEAVLRTGRLVKESVGMSVKKYQTPPGFEELMEEVIDFIEREAFSFCSKKTHPSFEEIEKYLEKKGKEQYPCG